MTQPRSTHHAVQQHVPKRQQISSVPTIQPAFWSFAITGQVRHPRIWSLVDLDNYPREHVRSFTLCSAAPPSLQHNVWSGVRLSTLLSEIEITNRATVARFHSADGYTTTVSLEALDSGIIAFAVNELPLTPEAGFPARLILPGRFGYKQPKWLERIEFTSSLSGGTWEDRGFDQQGLIQPAAYFTDSTFNDTKLTLEGYALGYGNVARVWLSIDGGDWMPATLAAGQVDDMGIHLHRWSAIWTPPYPGGFSLRVRAQTADGAWSPISTYSFPVV